MYINLHTANLGRVTHVTLVFPWQGVNIQQSLNGFKRLMYKQNYQIKNLGHVTHVTVVFTWQRVKVQNSDVYPLANSQFRLCDTCYVSFYVTGIQHMKYLCISANSQFRPCDTRYGSFYVTGEGWNKILMYKHWKNPAFWPCDTRYGSYYVTEIQRTEYWCIFICKQPI